MVVIVLASEALLAVSIIITTVVWVRTIPPRDRYEDCPDGCALPEVTVEMWGDTSYWCKGCGTCYSVDRSLHRRWVPGRRRPRETGETRGADTSLPPGALDITGGHAVLVARGIIDPFGHGEEPEGDFRPRPEPISVPYLLQ